jgi:aldose 1-epimerase
VWSVESITANTLVLKYRSADKEEGFPGTLDVTLSFQLKKDGDLVYEYTATTDKATAINLTHHSYFNLNNGEGSIAGHHVKLNSNLMLEQDANFVVTGNLIKTTNTIYDFAQLKEVGYDWVPADGYDQSFVIDNQQKNIDGLFLAAEAISKKSALKLEVFTNEPLVHFYTGKWIPVLNGKQGQVYSPFSGLCFETQKHPNAVNIPHFPDTILHPGQEYHTKTMYRVSQV